MTILENRMGLKLTCVDRSCLAILGREIAVVTHFQSTVTTVYQEARPRPKKKPGPNLFSGIIIFNGEDIFVRMYFLILPLSTDRFRA